MTKAGYEIGLMRSHIHDCKGNGEPIYSCDWSTYEVRTLSSKVIWVIPNHFKSKFGGDSQESRAHHVIWAESGAV